MRNFASPSRYIQGENALFENAQSISELGTHPVLLCDSVVYDIVGKRFEEYLGQNGLTVLPVFFNGEASDNEINRVVSLAEENGCDLVIGLGGGKTIDSAKAIADLLKSPVVSAPTKTFARFWNRRWISNLGRSACGDASEWKNHVGSTTNLSGCRHCTTL